MCRSIHQGGKRCKGCGYSAKQNGNRRSNRIARRKVSEYLLAQGMPEAAAAVLHAPPSVVPVILAKLDLDTDAILGDTPMPSMHAMSDTIKAQADEIAENAIAEKNGELHADEKKLQEALDAAEANVAAAEKHEDDLRKAKNRATVKRRKLEKRYKEIMEDPSDTMSDEDLGVVMELQQSLDDENAAKAAYIKAQKDTEAAKAAVVGDVHFIKKELLDEESYDAYCSSLEDDEIASIKTATAAYHADEIDDALAKSNEGSISTEKRDESVYTPGTVKIVAEDGSTTEQEGRLLDGGVAIVRQGYSDFVVLADPSGEGAYRQVGIASSKSQALQVANRITKFEQIASVDDPDNPSAAEVAKNRQAALINGLKDQAMKGSPESAQAVLAKENTQIAERTAAGFGDGEVADIADARRRHTQRLRVANAEEKGAQARQAALATGASAPEAQAAYEKAYRAAMGTPTLGGGTIPHFDHKIPPETIGQQQWTKLSHSGIRTYGTETANDYSVVSERGGDLKAWGFSNYSGVPSDASQVKVSSVTEAQSSNLSFVNSVLSQSERDALTRYTGGGYTGINAAITGREPNPSPSIKGTVGYLQSAFEKHAKHTPSIKPLTLLRGTRVPSGWQGSPSEYINSVFKPGEKVQIGKVTSCTTNPGTAQGFTGHPPYMMVIQTRAGIPVKAISNHKGEDEVVLPLGHDLRCVRVDKSGINGVPTVYLVAEDLVAEAQESVGPKGGSKMAA